MDKNDLAALLVGAPADEVDRIHRLLQEWNTGPEGSFPVQLALLTRAQWRMAATLPRLMNDSRKLLELHLVEYQRRSQLVTDDFVGTAKQQMAELKIATETVRVASKKINVDLAEAEAVVRRTRSLMDGAVDEWSGIKATTAEQCNELKKISNDLQNRFAWREMLWGAFCYALVFGTGIYLGHYAWKY